jgi:hypothetical protein
MTFPVGEGTIINNFGPANPNAGVNAEPVYPPSAAPNPTGDLVVAGSPDGVNTGTYVLTGPYANTTYSAGSPALFNQVEGITSTTQLLEHAIAVESEQQGIAALTSTLTIAGTPSVQVNNWNSGSVGTIGSKFS